MALQQMTVKTNKVKKASKRATDKAKGIKMYGLPLAPASQQQLEALCHLYDFEDWRELLTLAIQAMFNECDALTVPRHDYVPSKKMLRRLYDEGRLARPEEDE